MAKIPCPYKSLPETSYWKRSVAAVEPALIDPIVSTKFKIGKDDKIATAGSCFAQHISRYMSQSGYNYFIPENAHPAVSDDLKREFNYGIFSCRFGNLYTTRQLMQLVDRAYGKFSPKDDAWIDGKSYVDPYRPFIQPGGFSSKAEFDDDRTQHFAAVRTMIEQFDVFVFTLGLTEMWQSTEDGAVYPVCPGCGVGQHDTEKHSFHNLSVTEVIDDLTRFVKFAKEKNKDGRILLTVSPVPLIATFENKHVLSATVLSKSILRVAAQAVADQFDHVDYFPSYEIITGSFNNGAYYEEDLREVRELGVNHAMRCFFRHYVGEEIEIYKGNAQDEAAVKRPAQTNKPNLSAQINEVICDEETMAEAFGD